MVRLARDLWPAWCPGPAAARRRRSARARRARRDRRRAPAGATSCSTSAARRTPGSRRSAREHDLIGLADEPLEIRWTPVFLRAFGGAMLSSPGPLDKGQKAFFSITPMPDDWTDEQRESYLREDNDRMLRLLTIHEAVPGHYLQGVYANRCPSLVRVDLRERPLRRGLGGLRDPGDDGRRLRRRRPGAAARPTGSSTCARSINAIIDARIHTGGMTGDEAVALMVDGGFQEEAEARAKFDRARLSSTQLSTYFVGSMEMWDIELEVRRRAASTSGDPRGAGAVPEPRVVGGFGETPGFVYRRAPRSRSSATARRRPRCSGASCWVEPEPGPPASATGAWAGLCRVPEQRSGPGPSPSRLAREHVHAIAGSLRPRSTGAPRGRARRPPAGSRVRPERPSPRLRSRRAGPPSRASRRTRPGRGTRRPARC